MRARLVDDGTAIFVHGEDFSRSLISKDGRWMSRDVVMPSHARECLPAGEFPRYYMGVLSNRTLVQTKNFDVYWDGTRCYLGARVPRQRLSASTIDRYGAFYACDGGMCLARHGRAIAIPGTDSIRYIASCSSTIFAVATYDDIKVFSFTNGTDVKLTAQYHLEDQRAGIEALACEGIMLAFRDRRGTHVGVIRDADLHLFYTNERVLRSAQEGLLIHGACTVDREGSSGAHKVVVRSYVDGRWFVALDGLRDQLIGTERVYSSEVSGLAVSNGELLMVTGNGLRAATWPGFCEQGIRTGYEGNRTR